MFSRSTRNFLRSSWYARPGHQLSVLTPWTTLQAGRQSRWSEWGSFHVNSKEQLLNLMLGYWNNHLQVQVSAMAQNSTQHDHFKPLHCSVLRLCSSVARKETSFESVCSVGSHPFLQQILQPHKMTVSEFPLFRRASSAIRKPSQKIALGWFSDPPRPPPTKCLRVSTLR